MARKAAMRPSILSLKIVHDLYINKKGITIKDLAKNIKTDYKNVHDSVNILSGKGIITKEKIGGYNICRLNYSNDGIVQYLKEFNFYIMLKEFRKKYGAEYRILAEVCERLQDAEPFFVGLVFGSYARGEEKKESDIDVLFLMPAGHLNEKEIKNIINRVNAPYQKKFHVVSQAMADFIIDLKKIKELSIATEIYKEQPIVFYGDDIFFRIMVEANKLW